MSDVPQYDQLKMPEAHILPFPNTIVDITMARLSGLQREVLKLYRACVRTLKTKPEQNREHWRLYIKEEFGKHRHIPKKLFSVIEHLIRVGHRRYEMYLNPNIKDIH